MVLITLQKPITVQAHIEPKLAQMAQAANALMGAIGQMRAWSDDVLTDDHAAAGLILDESGEPLSAERLALYRATFAALDALRLGANAPRANGQPSVGALLRPFL
jgi:hypothetical protein